MDQSSEENCKKLYEQVNDVDILINNAGFGAFGEFTKTCIETELEMIKTNIQNLLDKNTDFLQNTGASPCVHRIICKNTQHSMQF